MSAPAEQDEAWQEARELAEALGAERYTDLAGRVLALDDPDTVWIVLEGRVDIQAAPLREGRIAGRGRYLFETRPGHLIPGTLPQPGAGEDGLLLGLRGRCSAGTELARTTRQALRSLSLNLDALVAIERWVECLAAIAAPQPRAVSTDLLEADPDQPFPPGAVLCAPHGNIVWAMPVEGEARALGDPALALHPGDAAWPLTEGNWITLPEGATLTGQLTPARMASGAIWRDLDAFGRMALRHLAAAWRTGMEQDAGQQSRQAAWARRQFQAGMTALGRVVDPRITAPPDQAAAEGEWAEIFALVAAASGIDMPPLDARATEPEALALAAGVAYRTVRLDGDWYRRDAGPLLGFLAEAEGSAQSPIALLQDKPGQYRMLRGAGDAGVRVTAALAARLQPTALMLYRPLPAGLTRLWPMLRFGTRGLRGDLGTVLGMGMLAGLLALLVPIASGTLMESVLPRADLGLHLAIIGGLGAAALANAAFTIVQSIAAARVQARVDLSAGAGVWNRLLRLRMGFFRANSTADLAERAQGISEIRRAVAGAVTGSLLSGTFSLLNVGLLLFYAPRLAIFALGFALLVMLLQIGLFLVQMPRQRAVVRAAGRLEALTFETLSAMPKLRAAAAEPRAFGRWAAQFAHYTGLRGRAEAVNTLRAVFNAVFPLFGTALLWVGAVGSGVATGAAGTGAEGQAPMSLGTFIAFQAAFAGLLTGIVSLVQGGEALVAVAPIWERLRPILEAEAETGLGREPVGELRGEIAVSHVTFRYEAEAPPVLNDVSLRIAPGEYVALVGPSGSGKSSLVRLILGLEQPEAGAVYVDGMDLATLDLAALRRQVGVVMQGGELVAGSVLDNILGAAPLPEEAAWEAARQAGLAEDIRAMPMRMQTVLSEGGGGLSGGQRQRLLIARALVRRPRLLMFDEATSALDNATQSAVKESLDKLNVTRLVVAHRLSTIRDVHRIIVMENGRIVEEGSYDALLAQDGLFARLAARQMA